jgi:polysaccharide export outer membrane protein
MSHISAARHLRLTALIAIVAGCVACSTIPKEILDEANKPAVEYLIGPEDLLEVTVWRNQDLSRQVVVRPDGMISMPLIGDLQARGMTANQLAQRITERLKEYKESPVVTVSVKEVNSYYFYVVGEVLKPGKYQPKSFTTVLQGLAMAGGFGQFAWRNEMQVVRYVVNGNGVPHEIRIPISYKNLLKGSGEPGNFFLKTGDTIVVP